MIRRRKHIIISINIIVIIAIIQIIRGGTRSGGGTREHCRFRTILSPGQRRGTFIFVIWLLRLECICLMCHLTQHTVLMVSCPFGRSHDINEH